MPPRFERPLLASAAAALATVVTAAAMAATPAAPAAAPPAAGRTAAKAAPPSAALAAPGLAAAADGGLDLRDATGVVAHVPVATPALRRGNVRLALHTIAGHRVAEVRIPVRGRPAEEVWIGDLGARPARVIWSGVTGPRDADEEVSVGVDVSDDAGIIVEFQTAPRISRCDGEPAWLFPRAWDFASGRFRPVVSAPPPMAAQRLTAHRGDPAMPAGRPIGGFHFAAASTTAGAGTDARALEAPVALDDGDPGTVWTEGLGGDGRGEFLTAHSSAGRYRVRGLRIVPGDASSPAAFKARNRIKTLALALGPEPERRFEIDLPEDPAAAAGQARAPYWVPLPAPVETACITVAIRDVYRGSEAAAAQQRAPGAGGTTAIADLEVFTELDDPAGVERLVTDTAAGVDCGPRVPTLVELGERAVLPAAQAVLTATGVGRECLVEALARIDATPKSPIALDALAAALSGATEKEERLILGTFRKTTAPPFRAVADLLAAPKAAVDDRARAARALGQLATPDATTALLDAAGAGPAPLRLAVVQAIGRAPAPAAAVEAVVAAIADAERAAGPASPATAPATAATPATAPTPAAAATPAIAAAAPATVTTPAMAAATAREADLLWALPPLVRRAPETRGAAMAAARRALGPAHPFEVRARAVMALGAAGDPTAVGDLAALRAAEADPVMRFLATRELGESTGSPEAVAALRTALDDGDPRVRETAALGLGRGRDGASEALLIRGAKQEPWPFVRRAEIEALAHLCGAAGRDLMVRAHQRDVDEVRRAAMTGLLRCRDGRAHAVLFQTLRSRRAGAPLRELAASLIGELGALGDATAAGELAAATGPLVNEAEGDLAIEGVTVSALRALAHLGGPDAATVAARLAQDRRHPYRHTAVEILGQLCDPGAGARALASLRTATTEPQLSLSARAAEEHCAARPPTTPPRP